LSDHKRGCILFKDDPIDPPGFPATDKEYFIMCSQQAFRRPHIRPDYPVKPPEPGLYMPATPPLATLAVIEFWLNVFLRRHHFRRLFRPLLEEDDLVLSDIGLNRSDIKWAIELPLKFDALKALGACRKAREAQVNALPIDNQDGKHTGDALEGPTDPYRHCL
jgi:hypothetical protein